jgi:hypothetical protein
MLVNVAGLSSCITKSVLPPGASAVTESFMQVPPATMEAGSQTTLAVTVVNDTQNLGVDWIASCSAANCGSFNPAHTASGVGTVFTAPNSVPTGNTVNLSARSTASPSESVTVTVTIVSNVSITITGFPASPLAAGSTTQVTAKVTGDPNNLGVNWSVLCASSSCGLITQQTPSGVAATYTAPTGITSPLNVTINASPVADTSQIVTTNLIVNPTASVSIAFASGAGAPPATMVTNATASVVANVTNDSQNLGVDWKVSCSNGANGCGTLNPGSPAHTASGAAIAFTAPATVPSGGLAVTISASATASPSATVSSVITVNVPVITISPISGAPSSMPVNAKANLSATITNDPSSGGGVNWLVTCTPGAGGTCGTFSSGLPTDHTASGVVTVFTAPSIIPLGSLAGTVIITATSNANPSSSSTVTIPITPSTAISINFATGANAPPRTMLTSANASIAAVVTNDNLTPPNGVDWSVTCGSSGTGACGTFSLTPPHTASGGPIVYTSPAQIPTSGTVTVTATSTANPSASVSQTITVNNPVLTVTITQAASPMDAGTSESIIAQVLNDSTQKGVTWSASCTNSTNTGCGTFNPTQSTGNGPETSYTAPSAVPTGGITVTITATSVADGITTGTAQITVNPNPNLGLLSGAYALNVSGTNASGFYYILGSLEADGQGNITGIEDMNGFAFCTPATATAVTGTYSVGADGRGTMTIQSGNGCFGQTVNGLAGVQTFSFVVVGAPQTTAPRALIIEFDNSTASGSLDLQTGLSAGMSAINGNYGFLVTGVDLNGPNANGISTADVGGTLSANGTGGAFSSGFQDVNDQVTGTITKKQAVVGTYSAPDPTTGRGTATLGVSGSQFDFVYYLVSANQIKLLSFDLNDPLIVGGSAYAQGSAANGPYVFTAAGADSNLGSSLVSGGLFILNGTNLTAGVVDVNDNGPIATNSAFTGTVTGPTSGRGTLAITGANTGGLTTFAFYPTATNGILLLELDSTLVSAGYALPQIQSIISSDFQGNYATNFTGVIQGAEEDADAQVISDGNVNLSGTADVNGGPTSGVLGAAVTGTFTANANGRFTGPLHLALSGTSTQTIQEIFYIADTNNVLFIENDANGQTSGFMQLQNLTLP